VLFKILPCHYLLNSKFRFGFDIVKLETNFTHEDIVSACSTMLHYIRDHVVGRWCDIVLNDHALREDEIDDMKDRFYEELEHVLDKFPTYHMTFFTRFQCQSREGRHFQTNNWE
jgi:hypothetical protein